MGHFSKGVSPVVASVLLIAFSIAIATIVGTWAMNYTQRQLSTLEEKNYCEDVSIQQLNFSYNPNLNEGVIRVQNSGQAIDGYRIYAFSADDQQLVKEISQKIAKGEIKTISFEISMAGPREIMLEVVNCPMVKLKFNI